jgi:hypothetical protein
VNVNLLTHLAYERTLHLTTVEGLPVTEAKKQAESEVLKSFGIEGDFDAAEDLNIFGESDQNAALLAISILMQGDLSEADFSERLANYAADIETDGIWNDSKTATKIADWASEQSLEGELTTIRNNIETWNHSANVPAFESFIENFWQNNYGIGTCNSNNQESITQNKNATSTHNDEHYICKSNTWSIATTLDYDTYKHVCDEDGKIIYGNVTGLAYLCKNKKWIKATDLEASLNSCTESQMGKIDSTGGKWFICKNNTWEPASSFEIDTYKWTNGIDGDSKTGNFYAKNCYVYENNTWRVGNTSDCSLNLQGCTRLRQNTIALGADSSWYICDNRKWRNATDIEKDTATWGAGVFNGEVRSGQVNTEIYYIYEASKKTWRNATIFEYDTYQMDCLKDGSIINGRIHAGNKYVCDTDTIRIAKEEEIQANLGCTNYTQNEYRILSGQYSYYKCEKNGWTITTEKINYGTMTDSRDGHEYKTVGIKHQIWMAENLKYHDSTTNNKNTWCFNNEIESCEKYGRLYSRYFAKETDICPQGWHLPKFHDIISLATDVDKTIFYKFFEGSVGTYVRNGPACCGGGCHLKRDGEISWIPYEDCDEAETLDPNIDGIFIAKPYYWISTSCTIDSAECSINGNFYGAVEYWDEQFHLEDLFNKCYLSYGVYIRCIKNDE